MKSFRTMMGCGDPYGMMVGILETGEMTWNGGDSEQNATVA